MIQVVKKWRIEISFNTGNKGIITLFIHDNFYSNVLRKLADISFEGEVFLITINLVIESEQEGIFHS